MYSNVEKFSFNCLRVVNTFLKYFFIQKWGMIFYRLAKLYNINDKCEMKLEVDQQASQSCDEVRLWCRVTKLIIGFSEYEVQKRFGMQWIEKQEKKRKLVNWFMQTFKTNTCNTCQCITGRRGLSTISLQCLSSGPFLLYPRVALPIGSDEPILS